MIFGWIWIAVIVLAFVLELLTDQLISIWFVPGAIIATILDFCEVDVLWQVLVVLVIAALGIVFAKTFLSKKLNSSVVKTNIDAIIGERCVVTEKIDNYVGCGLVKVKGQVWSARGVGDDDIFEVGDRLTVVAIEGVKLVCRKN